MGLKIVVHGSYPPQKRLVERRRDVLPLRH